MMLCLNKAYLILFIIGIVLSKTLQGNITGNNQFILKYESKMRADSIKSITGIPVPPNAEQIEKTFTEHGNNRIDKYFWLRDVNNPKVIEHLKAENAYTEAVMKHTEPLQEKLYNEMLSRIKQDDSAVPYFENGFYYYTRFEKGFQYPLYCRKKDSLSSAEEIMLNINEMAKGFELFKIGMIAVSPDNNLLAYSVDTAGNNKYIIFFKELTTNRNIGDTISNTSGEMAWANDNSTVFYSINDNTNRSYKIIRHSVGNKSENDEEVYHEKDAEYTIFAKRSKSGKFILIYSGSMTTSEVYFIDADNPAGELKLIEKREENHIYNAEHLGDKFYIRTNYKADNYKMVSCPVNKTSKENWTDLIEYKKDIFLYDFDIFKNYIVLSERVKGLTKLRVINLEDNSFYYIDFPEEDYEAFFKDNKEINRQIIRFSYTSLKTPSTVFDYDLNTRTKTLLKQDEVLGGYNSDDYITERLYARAKDGVEIPISIIYKKGISKNGNNPLLLTGYGAYGFPSFSRFLPDRLCLLNRGIIIAIAHIRGGGEMGRQWYEDGKFFKKMNTFNDFIACAEFLIGKEYTNPAKLFANGGSAGGLLVSAVANFRPDLFKGIIGEVPWVDVIADMLDESIPLTTLEYKEWGNPNEKSYYDYMLSYSPYDNVCGQNYPAILATGGLNDYQVMYWNPARWIAKLRELKTDNNPVLLKINMDTGHSGKSGRFERFKETAFKYAFILDQLGIDQ